MRSSTTTSRLGILLAALLAAPAAAGTDVRINGDASGTVQNEIRITQNATDLANLLVAYNDDAGALSSPLGVSFSLDGGASWSDRQLGIPSHPLVGTPDDGSSLSFIFDPFIDSDSQGNVYAGYIATDGAAGGPSGIYIERSTNKGATWSGPTTIDFNVRSIFAIPPGSFRFNDRPDMTVDSNHVYVVWIKDVGVNQPTSDIYFAKSPPPGAPSPGNPTGLDFSGGPPGSVAPQTVNDFPNGFDQANVPDVAVASDGTVYVAWIDVNVTNMGPKPGTLKIDRSMNGGVSFGPDTTVLAIAALANHVSTAAGGNDDARSGSYPAIAVDPANPQIVYLAYAADPPGSDEADIFFIRSTDGGLTWSAPLTVNDDGTTRDQIHPAIAVKPDGTIDLAWYDKRVNANDDRWDVYFANSTDGGASFSANLRITDQDFATPTNSNASEPWLGEYLGLTVDSAFAYIAFTSSVTPDSKGDVYFDVQPNQLLLTAAIDVKPGSFPNGVNPRSKGLLPVAILTTSTADGDPSDFDAAAVDVASVELGSGAAAPVHGGHLEDADGDGDLDLVLHFRTRDTGIACGDSSVALAGQTTGGQTFAGADSVKTAGCK